jgi:hypothetical protein
MVSKAMVTLIKVEMVKLSPEDEWGAKAEQPFLTFLLDRGKSASCSGRFSPGETACGTNRTGGWMGPKSWSGHYGEIRPLMGMGPQPSSL